MLAYAVRRNFGGVMEIIDWRATFLCWFVYDLVGARLCLIYCRITRTGNTAHISASPSPEANLINCELYSEAFK